MPPPTTARGAGTLRCCTAVKARTPIEAEACGNGLEQRERSALEGGGTKKRNELRWVLPLIPGLEGHPEHCSEDKADGSGVDAGKTAFVKGELSKEAKNIQFFSCSFDKGDKSTWTSPS